MVSDFGMLTAIATMVTLSYFLRNTITIETLEVPAGFKPSNSSERGWIIDPLHNLEYYHVIGAIIPAFLVKFVCLSLCLLYIIYYIIITAWNSNIY